VSIEKEVAKTISVGRQNLAEWKNYEMPAVPLSWLLAAITSNVEELARDRS
jgi:hypothetical protein